VDLEAARRLARAALLNLEAHRQRIDDLNVYPVPDGDTGTNMALTVRSVVDALESSTAEGNAAVWKEMSRAALLGARGNSGVIFSQIARGFADVLGASEGTGAAELPAAFRAASDAAYRAVREPAEGTMLTVVREMAEESERPEHAELGAPELLRTVLDRGEDALARTPELLDVLREAGVVDAGGAGLVEILRGIVLEVSGEALPEVPVESEALGLEAIHLELSRYRYCTGFVVEGDGLDVTGLERSLELLGDSLLVVGDATALKVHVHTDDPGAAISAATSMGVVGRVEIANMHAQTFEREGRLLAAPGAVEVLETGVVAVCPGEGNRRLFKELGATTVIEGGQTMNPSAAEIVEAIEATPAAEIIVLPNNSNVIATAEQAMGLTSRPARVVPSRSVQAGFAAMVSFLSTSSPDENERAMNEALAAAATGEVTVASRDATLDGISIREGAYLGLVDGEAVAAADDLESVTLVVVERLLGGGRGWLGVLVGADAPPIDGLLDAVQSAHPDVVLERHEGGQPHYPLLLVAE
jgi:DAK2 domain fusion protein YloV